MRANGSTSAFLATVLMLGCAVVACEGGNAELRPELRAHLDEYESLIDTFEPRFADARSDRARLADVADAYSQEVQAWLSQLKAVAPELSAEEGKAVQASINRLNKRAERMLRGD